MSMQDAEIKRDFLKRLWSPEGRSPYFAQLLFLSVGLFLTLSAFFVLQSFVHGLFKEEQARVSQDFVEEVVQDFYGMSAPLEAVSAMVALSDAPTAKDISAILQQKEDEYKHYSQILWFHKPEGKAWTYSNLLGSDLQREVSDTAFIEPSSDILKKLLSLGALNVSKMRLADNVAVFQSKQHRQSPKMLSTPFVVTHAVEVDNAGKGFLLAVMDTAALYNESWIEAHRNLAFAGVKDIDSGAVIFEFERNREGQSVDLAPKQVYEFPFGGDHWEISGMFALDQRARFLNMFPYIVGIFGLLIVCAGTFYIRNNQRQAGVLAELNETLEQKNFELKADAEERERLAEAIKEAEQKSRAVIDAVGDVILETDAQGYIVFLNKAWNSVTGFDVEQSKGQALVQLIHPQDQAEVSSAFKALVNGQKSELRSFTQLRMADGTFKAVELTMNVVSHSGEMPSRIIGTFTDIEERRRAERALSDAEKKYRSIVENAAGGIFQLTAEGLYLSANPAMARILGYDSPEQLLREVKNANEQLYVAPNQPQSFYAKLLEKKETLSQEVQMRCRDGQVMWVKESARAVQDDNGQLLFVEGNIEDITQRRESENAIHEAKIHSDLANRAKSEFLSNMSHELRTPLNSIIGFSEMIKNEVYGKIEQTTYWEYARDIHESGQKLLRVINEILDISKIEAGERQLNEGVVNIPNLVDSALDLLDVKVEGARMVVTKALDDVPDVIGEELALKQIVVNLLSNAIKFTPDEGRITISGHVNRDGRLHISVTDTGIGLDEYEVEKALSPFGQVESDLDRRGSGTGLGLTLVDALVTLHGGDFELFSQKGIGTTATIILPADRIVKDKEGSGSVDTLIVSADEDGGI